MSGALPHETCIICIANLCRFESQDRQYTRILLRCYLNAPLSDFCEKTLDLSDFGEKTLENYNQSRLRE